MTHESDKPRIPEEHEDDLVSDLGPAQPQQEEIDEATPGRKRPRPPTKVEGQRPSHDIAPDKGGDAPEEDRPDLPDSSEEAYGISGEETSR